MRTRSFNTGWEFAAVSWLAASGSEQALAASCGKLGFSTLEWLPARVPGHVHLDLIRHGIIADPQEGRAELGCQWVDESSWVFRKRFQFHKEAALPRQLLRFAGLDTVCAVWLNGERLAEHDNMFVPLELELTGKLREGENELRIVFESAARVGRERRARCVQPAQGGQHEGRQLEVVGYPCQVKAAERLHALLFEEAGRRWTERASDRTGGWPAFLDRSFAGFEQAWTAEGDAGEAAQILDADLIEFSWRRRRGRPHIGPPKA